MKNFLLILFFLIYPFSTLNTSQKDILLATTTSTQDSGLLDILIPIFEKKTGYFVKTIAVGSGHAIALGMKGEVDVLLVHSPSEEKKFMQQGYGIDRRLVMHNDFIIVGHMQDPSKIKGLKLAVEAFKKIAKAQALFISRGDNSGTHMKEMEIWKAARFKPEGKKWYQETGLGMGQTLIVTSEKRGYTISDRGTYMALRKNLGLDIMVEGDSILLNIYHVILVNPSKWKRVNVIGAKSFADFIVSKEAQNLIKTYGVDKFGSPLFFPDADKKELEN